ncbi:MAG TPA: PaeR7I family type II restriction endonuclease [Gemmatimonadales bacterium]|nr:PaeR7I family type II restriction endonuclease [Gemmatimonadales bacterium]
MPDSPLIYPWNAEESSKRVEAAVREFWTVRDAAGEAQRARGNVDAGTRGKVTAGKHLDAFAKLFLEVVCAAGFEQSEVHSGRNHNVPGYFRSQKCWDLVVIRDGRLCAAIELKSQVGSFSNNVNNRTEEALGSSTDFWVTFREGTLGPRRPWLGYFMLVEDHPKSRKSIKNHTSPLGIREEFLGSSYIDRYRILCERMVLEGQYSAAALLTAPIASPGAFSQPSEGLEVDVFMRSLFGHLVGLQGGSK